MKVGRTVFFCAVVFSLFFPAVLFCSCIFFLWIFFFCRHELRLLREFLLLLLSHSNRKQKRNVAAAKEGKKKKKMSLYHEKLLQAFIFFLLFPKCPGTFKSFLFLAPGHTETYPFTACHC